MSDWLNWLGNEPDKSKFQINQQKVKNMLLDMQAKGRGPLHDYQVDAVLKTGGILLKDEGEMLGQLNVETKPVVIVAPTGAGKSGMIFFLPYVIASSKVLIISPSKVISNQLAVAFGSQADKKSFLEEIGMITQKGRNKQQKLLEPVKVINGPDDLQENLPNVVIVNAQKFGGKSRMTLSLEYRNKEIIPNVEAFFKQFDTLIVDEAHHYPAKTWELIVTEFGKPVPGIFKKIIFLTATPYKVIRGREQFILGEQNKDRLAYQVTQRQVEGISTRPCKFVEHKHAPTHDNVYRDIIQIFKQNRKDEPRFNHQAMVIVWTKKEAKDLVQFLNDQKKDPNFAVAALANQQPGLEEFTQGQYRVAVTCGLAKEGYNNKNVTLCVILRNITSKVLFTQFVGRCVRLKRGLVGSNPDESTATVLSYTKFQQQALWQERERLATEDPDDSEVGDEESEEEEDFESNSSAEQFDSEEMEEEGSSDNQDCYTEESEED